MSAQSLERGLGGSVELDLCFPCQAVWFDQGESAQLAAQAVIDLFRLIHDHGDGERRALPQILQCPRCATRLTYTHDIVRSNAIAYYRCEFCRGRLTTFLQFLREKQFVRSLSAAEVAALSAQVRQVRCSGCGAAIDIGRDSVCPYCRAPVSVLDEKAVEKALSALQHAEPARRETTPASLADALIARERVRAAQREADIASGVDLVFTGIGALLDALAG
jgi:Zn-finger nucleic acid-binding protein